MGSAPLAQLERRLEQLIRRWERFVRNDPEVRIPPEVERVALERSLRELSREEFRTAAEQFRMEQLLHRFATFNGLWQRLLREREEVRGRVAAARAAMAATPGGNAPTPASVSAEDAEVHTLHRQYLAALRSAGSQAAVSLEGFRTALERQRTTLEQRGAAVEGFDVVQEDGAVKVRARIRRGRSS